MDVGRIFSTSFAMLRQRFWLLVGMWAVFFAIQLAGSTVLGIGMVATTMAGAAAAGGGLEDPSAFAGLGVGMIIFLVLFYGAYLVLILAQQAAMVTLASPLEDPAFGAALGRGFKSALPFFGIAVILMLGYVLIGAVIGGLVAAAGANAGPVVGAGMVLLFLPLLAFLGCRLSVLVPVVAVDQVFNPVTAIRRSWTVTRGKVLSILLAMIGFMLLSLVALGAPFALIFGGVFAAQDSEAAAAGISIAGFLLFIPLFIIYSIFASTFAAALHSEVTGGGAEALEDVFA